MFSDRRMIREHMRQWMRYISRTIFNQTLNLQPPKPGVQRRKINENHGIRTYTKLSLNLALQQRNIPLSSRRRIVLLGPAEDRGQVVLVTAVHGSVCLGVVMQGTAYASI